MAFGSWGIRGYSAAKHRAGGETQKSPDLQTPAKSARQAEIFMRELCAMSR
jgi:hypothetical protein